MASTSTHRSGYRSRISFHRIPDLRIRPASRLPHRRLETSTRTIRAVSDVLPSRVDPKSAEFLENDAHHRSLLAQLKAEVTRAREGGGAKETERHVARGKLPVRERIERLLDPDTAFLEVAPLAAHGM